MRNDHSVQLRLLGVGLIETFGRILGLDQRFKLGDPLLLLGDLRLLRRNQTLLHPDHVEELLDGELSGGRVVLELLNVHAQLCAATEVSAKISFTLWTATTAMERRKAEWNPVYLSKFLGRSTS